MYLNLMNDDEIKNQWNTLVDSDVVTVVVRVRWIEGICVPDNNGTSSVWAKFRRMTCGDYWKIEQQAAVSEEDDIKEKGRYIDDEITKKMIIRMLLLDWSLDIPLEFNNDNGYLTKESFDRAMHIPAPLMNAFLEQYEKTTEVSEDEYIKAERQSAVLFSQNSSGVSNACETVSLFCTLGNFWEKFGLNRFDLNKLPYREFMMLRVMVQKEGEAMKRSQSHSRGSNTKIAGSGGRTRPSRGIRQGS